MSLLTHHMLSFNGVVIADAAAAKADQIEAEIDGTEVDEARAAVEEALHTYIDKLVADELMLEVMRDHHRESVVLNESQRVRAVASDARQGVCFYVSKELWWKFAQADQEMRRRRAQVVELRKIAAAYRTQDRTSFDLDLADVEKVGLDVQPSGPQA